MTDDSSSRFHTQLASIMEVLANAAVAEICELMDDGYAALRLEISCRRKENEALRRKLHALELRTARENAERAAARGKPSSSLCYKTIARGEPRGRVEGRGRDHNLEPNPGLRHRATHTHTPEQCVNQSQVEEEEEGDVILIKEEQESREPTEAQGLRARREESDVILIKEEQESREPTEAQGAVGQGVDGGGASATDLQTSHPMEKKERAEPPRPFEWEIEEVKTERNYPDTHTHPNPDTHTHGYSHTHTEDLSHTHSYTHTHTEDPACSYSLNSEPAPTHSRSHTQSGATHPQDARTHHFTYPEHSQGAPPHAEHTPHTQRQEEAATHTHPTWVGGGSDPGRGSGKLFVCPFCGKALACLKNLKTHLRVHTGEKPYSCTQCGKRFSDSSNLKRHQSVHTGERRYGCTHCGKRFAQSGSLKVHLSVHTGHKGFRCARCGKTFISNTHLKRHCSAHHSKD